MRKHQHQRILDLLQTINQVQSSGVYSDCQEGALGLCDFIDDVAGAGTKTVELLEKHCELLFKAHAGEVDARLLQKSLVKIENSVKTELKPKIEMVFLSYKASMSDSIESIYLAAKEDPNCDAYWIPIPYLEFNSDGSVNKTVCEGQEFYPDYMECTNWQTYDLENRRPDVIFTFNPYDGTNYITSVHPNFYCERLRNFTDMLVYVPYFVLGDEVPNDCVMYPGCIYAHKVIIQSEKVREKYIEIFKNAFGNKHGNPEEKFIALGSPKFDKVINSKREDFTLPDEWRELINGKKVILYNTTIAALLKSGMPYLKKIRHVIKTFKVRDDVLLWWRPHPLNQAACKSMRPELLSEYQQIVEEYKRSNVGIYDDSADLHRAIAWSDAYYGDWSSVVILYRLTGKSMMQQNENILQPYAGIDVARFYGLLEDKTYYWFVEQKFNALFRVDKNTFNPEYMGSFMPDSHVSVGSLLYRESVELNNCIYFAPFRANAIAEYNKTDGNIATIPFKSDLDEKRGEFNFIGAFLKNGYVFFTPHGYPAIIRLNVLTKEIDYYSDWHEVLINFTHINTTYYFGYPCDMGGSSFAMASSTTNAVVVFDTSSLSSTVYEVGVKGSYYSCICYDGNDFWLTRPNDCSVIRWNPITEEYKEISDLYKYSSTPPEVRRGMFCLFCDGYVWIIDSIDNQTIKIDIVTESVYDAPELRPSILKSKNRLYELHSFVYAQSSENSVFTCEAGNGALIRYDCKTGERTEKTILYSAQDLSTKIPEFARRYLLDNEGSCVNIRKSIHYEQNYRPLEGYINHIVHRCGVLESSSAREMQLDCVNSATGIILYTKEQYELHREM